MKNFSKIINDKDIITKEYGENNSVQYTQAQSLTDAQKERARNNIGAGTSNFDGSYNNLSDKPTIPSNTSQLTNDSNFATTNQVNAKYTKPSAGIPKTDLASAVQTSLDYADNAVRYNASQSLTADQKTQARNNIGAGTSSFSGDYNDLSNKPTIPAAVSIVQVTGTSTTSVMSQKAVTDEFNNRLSKTDNTSIEVIGTKKNTTTLGGNQLVAPNGIIFAGTAANAGLVTRGICGVTSPDATGACSKENLYINYDSTDTFNAGRQLVLQAGSVGTHYGNNLYQYAVPRGDIVKAWVEAKGYLTSHQDISGKANIAGGNTFSGLQTINAPTDVSGSETTTLKAKTSNGGAIVFGKEGPNSGTMIRLDQADGTCRLRFRGSSTAGAMVWEQPEQGAQLYVDLGKDGSDKHRVSFPSSAGTLALTSQIPTVNNGTLTIQKNGTNVQTFTANQSSSVTANITVPTKTSELTNDSGYLTAHQDISGKANLAGGNTFSGKQTMPIVETGSDDSNYFQCRKFRGEGDASTYYHAIDFGYPSHDQVDFYEYGGVYNFWKNTSSSATSDENNLCLQIGQTGLKNKANTFTFPSKSGTFAMTSDIPDVSGKANLSGGNTFTGYQQFDEGLSSPSTIEANGLRLTDDGIGGYEYFSASYNQNNPFVNFGGAAGSCMLMCDGNEGTFGQVLTSRGTGQSPQWTSIPTYSLSGTTLTITLP